MYKENLLKEYIDKSLLKIYNDRVKVRLSSDLLVKYESDIYDNFLKHISESLNKIESLGIIYPSNSKPILYIYIVPDHNFEELLQIPSTFRNGKRGGKPVVCFDIDGFNSAYGLNQYILENTNNNYNISREENEIHELSHIVMSMFKKCGSLISEGFAECLPLYILNYESTFIEHNNILIDLTENNIYSAKELLDQEKNNTFGNVALKENRSCSFRASYISSYLFVRGCIEKIEEVYNLDKIKATQYFLEILRSTNTMNEWLIYDIANAIKMDKDELLNSKDMQLRIIKKLKNS